EGRRVEGGGPKRLEGPPPVYAPRGAADADEEGGGGRGGFPFLSHPNSPPRFPAAIPAGSLRSPPSNRPRRCKCPGAARSRKKRVTALGRRAGPALTSATTMCSRRTVYVAAGSHRGAQRKACFARPRHR